MLVDTRRRLFAAVALTLSLAACESLDTPTHIPDDGPEKKPPNGTENSKAPIAITDGTSQFYVYS
ncbi:MAG TPA: hypothetical protein VGX50_07085 [Longimicrobium sp.]|nr:hypothetical protein [Longimicrobium sp.]